MACNIPQEDRNVWFKPPNGGCVDVNYDYTDTFCSSDCAETRCIDFDPCEHNLFPPPVLDKQDTSTINQSFTTDYLFTFAGIEIPIIKTRRTFSASWSREYPRPEQLAMDQSGLYVVCGDRKPWKFDASISENCVIEASTLHYMDIENRVLLYQYRRESIVFSETSDKCCTFYPGGNKASTYAFNKIAIKNKTEAEAPYNGLVEWRLIIDGQQAVISSEQYKKAVMPTYGPQVFEEDGVSFEPCEFYGGGGTDTYTVFKLPAGMSTDMIRTHDSANNMELYCNGWYDIAGSSNEENIASGNFSDFFYPVWCRSLTPDPFWAAAANARNTTGSSDNNYTPPAISVDPFPKGTYSKHPKAGELYQFLVKRNNGSTAIKESVSPDMRALLLDKYDIGPVTYKGLTVTHKAEDILDGTLLNYPISSL